MSTSATTTPPPSRLLDLARRSGLIHTPAAPPPMNTLFDHADRLAAAEGAIAALEAKRPALLFDSDAGDPNAKADLLAVDADLAEARKTADDLRLVIAEGGRRLAAKDKAALAMIRASQVRATKEHLRLARNAAQSFANAQQAACEAFRLLLKHRAAAAAAAPGGMLAAGSLVYPGEIIGAVQLDLWRLGHDVQHPQASFPGAAAPTDYRLVSAPERIESLTDVLARTDAGIMGQLAAASE